MTCSKLDDSAINGSGYAVTTVRLERSADIANSILFESTGGRSPLLSACRVLVIGFMIFLRCLLQVL